MKYLSILSVVALLSGCAHPVIQKCDNPDTCGEGVIFNRPDPYLIVAPSGQLTVIYLPNPAETYRITREGWFGDVSLSETLSDGWNLTGSNSNGTTTQELESALGSLSGAAGTLKMGGAMGMSNSLATGLYKIDLTNHKLIGPIR